jgi:hypothetical protein
LFVYTDIGAADCASCIQPLRYGKTNKWRVAGDS